MPDGISVSDFVADQIQQRLQRLSSQAKITLRLRDADAVHDLRVAIRRLRQTLTTLRAWFDAAKVERIRRRLKDLLKTAGSVRDCDIAIDLLSKSGAQELGDIGDALHSRRETAARRMLSALRGFVRQKKAMRWSAELALIEAPIQYQGKSWDELARFELPRRAKAFFRLGQRAAKAKASGAGLHQLRIEIKKLRYTLEMFRSTYPPTVEARIESLHEFQMTLGKITDLRTVRNLVNDLDGGEKLAAMLRKKQRKRMGAFRSYWETQFPPNQREEWMWFLRQPVRKPVMRSGSAIVSKGEDAPRARQM